MSLADLVISCIPEPTNIMLVQPSFCESVLYPWRSSSVHVLPCPSKLTVAVSAKIALTFGNSKTRQDGWQTIVRMVWSASNSCGKSAVDGSSLMLRKSHSSWTTSPARSMSSVRIQTYKQSPTLTTRLGSQLSCCTFWPHYTSFMSSQLWRHSPFRMSVCASVHNHIQKVCEHDILQTTCGWRWLRVTRVTECLTSDIFSMLLCGVSDCIYCI